tara:strand:- start:659 stop:832 length:174 start_codon:yes stop_codon:yes gene_type:complete
MTKGDVAQILTELAVIKNKMENVEARVNKLDKIVFVSICGYFTITFTGVVSFVLMGQ